MKKLISLALVASFSLSVFATDIFDFAPINGNVKSYTQTEFSITSKFGNYYRTPSSKVVHVLDETGKEIESSELSQKDTVVNKIVTTYDEEGRIQDQSCINSDGEMIWKTSIKYKNGLKVETSEYDERNELRDKVIYTYDGAKLVDETGYDKEGVLAWKTLYKYNDAARVEKESNYLADGSLDNRVFFTYFEDGKTETVSTFDNFSKESKKEVFRYDGKGLLTEITSYGSDNAIYKRTTIKYDSHDNVIKVSEYNIAQKFDTTVNELIAMVEYVYEYY